VKRLCSRVPSRSSSLSRPVTLTDSSMAAEMTPMMATTTRISISVKPRAAGALAAGRRRRCGLVADVPVADVGIEAFTAGCAIGSEAEQVVLFAVRARVDVLVVVPPGVLADALQVAARAPVLDGRVGGLRDQRRQALLRGRVLGVVEPVHGERRLQALDVLLRLGDARLVHFADHLR